MKEAHSKDVNQLRKLFRELASRQQFAGITNNIKLIDE